MFPSYFPSLLITTVIQYTNMLKQMIMICLLTLGKTTDFDNIVLQFSQLVIDTYFNNSCIVFITDIQHNMLRDTKSYDNQFSINLADTKSNLSHILLRTFDLGCRNYLIQVQNKNAIVTAIVPALRTTTTYRGTVKNFMVLPAYKDDTDMTIFNSPDMFYTPCLILAVFKDSKLLLYTTTVLNGHKYEKLNITNELLGTWNPGANPIDLFYDRVTDLHGKRFVISMLNYPPYTVIQSEGGTWRSKVTMIDGLEVSITTEFIKLHNGTWIGKDHQDEFWGELDFKGSGIGIIGHVADHRSDMGISAVYQWFCEDLDCSIPYVMAHAALFVPKPMLLPGWLTVVFPFAINSWIAFIIGLIVASLIAFLLLVVEKSTIHSQRGQISTLLERSFYTMYQIQLQQSPKNDGAVLDTYKGIVAFYFFIVVVCWSAGLAAVLTVPRYEKPVNNVHDVLDKRPRLYWGGDSIVWAYAVNASVYPELKRIADEYIVLTPEQLQKRMDFGYFMERLHFGMYALSDYMDETLLKRTRAMENYVYIMNPVVALPKGSPYYQKLNVYIQKAIETGLTQIWVTKASLLYLDNNLQGIIKDGIKKPENKPTKLQVRHIEGALFFLVLGLTVSLMFFTWERLRPPKNESNWKIIKLAVKYQTKKWMQLKHKLRPVKKKIKKVVIKK